jgi:uncharacterized protein YegJ (DUF2314 family)
MFRCVRSSVLACAFIIASSGAIVSCDNQAQPANPAPANPGVKEYDQEDSGMNAAMKRARDEIGTLVTRLKTPVAQTDYLSIKVALPTQAGSKEHIWCGNVSHNNGTFTARIDNKPVDPQYKLGQMLTVQADQISDWMYAEKGKLVGGYTMLHHYSTLSDKEKAAMRKALPFQIE